MKQSHLTTEVKKVFDCEIDRKVKDARKQTAIIALIPGLIATVGTGITVGALNAKFGWIASRFSVYLGGAAAAPVGACALALKTFVSRTAGNALGNARTEKLRGLKDGVTDGNALDKLLEAKDPSLIDDAFVDALYYSELIKLDKAIERFNGLPQEKADLRGKIADQLTWRIYTNPGTIAEPRAGAWRHVMQMRNSRTLGSYWNQHKKQLIYLAKDQRVALVKHLKEVNVGAPICKKLETEVAKGKARANKIDGAETHFSEEEANPSC